jgi:proteasome assembly chaperone (PAC2) family protein
MPNEIQLNRPWLVAVWPGMGHVAVSAGFYLMAKLGMHQFAELSSHELFEVDHVDVKDGIIRPGRLPRSRLFAWVDPEKKRDIVVFIGEAQPPLGKLAFCHKLVEYGKRLGVERVLTFAAMATQMHPKADSRVFAAATNDEMLEELKKQDLDLMDDGSISGLNGILLGVAAGAELQGACLLGEMPHMFAQLPFPKASLAVLKVFASIAGIQLDYTEMLNQVAATDQHLEQILTQVEQAIQQQRAGAPPEEAEEEPFPAPEPRLSPQEQQQIESLFAQAEQDRSKAYELKALLDRLDAFSDYEDRFLDLFKKLD